MKLHSTVTAGLNTVTAYGAGYVAVDGRVLKSSFILTPQQLIENWPAHDVARLNSDDLAEIAKLDCPILLLGTGATQRFPDPMALRPLIARQIGVEVMDNFAACRTYNILMAEGRAVALALIMAPGA